MSEFIASPFSLAQGTIIQADVRATNSKGSPDYSSKNTAGALVTKIPQVALVLSEGSGSTGTSLVI